jgi:hypothetical protein
MLSAICGIAFIVPMFGIASLVLMFNIVHNIIISPNITTLGNVDASNCI